MSYERVDRLMKIKKSRLNIYFMFLSIFFYALFDVMNSASSGNNNGNRGIVYLFLFIIIGCMIKKFIFQRYKKINKLELSMCIFTIYLILHSTFTNTLLEWNQFILIILSVWWFFTINYWRNLICDKEIVLLVNKFIKFIYIFYSIVMVYSSINIVSNFSTNYARVGYIYHILALFPFVLLMKNKKEKNTYIILTYILSFISLKRGAIIILPVTHLCYIFFQKEYSTKKILKIILSFALLFSAFLIFNNMTNGYLKSRFTIQEISDGSGRGETNKDAIENLKKRNIIQLFFGIQNENEAILETGIHNELLSEIYTYGIIGLIIYLNIYLNIIMLGIKLAKKDNSIKSSYYSMFIYLILLGTVSGVYFVHSTFYIMMYIGYICAIVKLNAKSKKNVATRSLNLA